MSGNTNKKTLEADYELIQRFFEWELSEVERQAFEQRMEVDAVFLQRIENYQSIEDKMTSEFDQEETIILQNVQKDWKNTPQESARVRTLVPKKRWLQITSIAASFLLLFALAWYLLPSNTHSSPQVLAQNYYQKTGHQGISSFRSSATQNPTDKILEEAGTAFKAQKYKNALELLQPIPSTYPLYHQVLLLQGQCYFELGDKAVAIEKFQTILDAPEGNQKDLALWYQALVHLQQNELEQAKQNLKKIVAERYPIAKEASALLKQLE